MWPRVLFTILFAGSALQAQQPNVAAQRDAMKKLSFLVGAWSGPASIRRGPGEALKITQSEQIEMKMDGLVMVIEGTGRGADGKAGFRAFATISYDDETSTYHFRAYNDGHYLDTELKVSASGFEWGYAAGPLKVTNRMKVTEAGEWQEVTESTFGSAPPQRSVEMLLKRQ
jgi:hypothetical protein